MGDLKELYKKLRVKGIDAEYIGKPEINIYSYSLHRFVRFYLSHCFENNKYKNDFDKDNANALHELCEYINYTLTGQVPVCIEETEKVIALLRESGDANEQTIKQFVLIRHLLKEKSSEDLFPKIIDVLFSVFDSEEMVYPALIVLFNNYGLFLNKLYESKPKEELRAAVEDYEKIKRQLYLLTIYATPKVSINTWKNDFSDELPVYFGEVDVIDDDSKNIQNMIIEVGTSTYNALSNARFLPFYYSDDEDLKNTQVGNMITLVDKCDSTKKIIYQIAERIYFDSYLDMFINMGIECFGFKNESVDFLSQKCKEFFRNVSENEYSMALYVIKI